MQSLQRVLTSIQMEQVCGYLDNTGWTKKLDGARVDFEKKGDSAQEPYRVFLPASSAHPRFRQLLPNLVFSVSIVEGREPIHIATDMASIRILPPESSSPRPEPPGALARFQLKNSSPHDIELIIADRGGQYRLPAGGELIVLQTAVQLLPIFELTSAASIRIEQAQVLLGLPAPSSEPLGSSLRKWLEEQGPSQSNVPARQTSEFIAAAQSLLSQFCFATEALEGLVSQPAPLLRASAVLLCGLSQLMGESEVSEGEIFQLARHLLSPARLTFAPKSQQAASLWQTARNDQPIAPVNTLAWLTQEALPVAG